MSKYPKEKKQILALVFASISFIAGIINFLRPGSLRKPTLLLLFRMPPMTIYIHIFQWPNQKVG